MDVTESPSALLERKKEHQRMRNRMKQKRHRDRNLLERQELYKQVEELTQALVEQKKDSEKNKHAIVTLRNLRKECKETRQLAQAMTTWVASMASTIPINPAYELGWTKTNLIAERSARKLGMDWLSQHLYHNTDRIISYAAFPSGGDITDMCVMEFNEEHINLLGRIQTTYAMPLEQAYETLKVPIWAALRGDTNSFISEFLDQDITQAIDKNMLYRRTVVSEDEANYYICREFHSQDRIVFLMGNVNEDALLPKNKHWRPRMFWYVIERLSPVQTRLRVVLYNAPYIMDGKMISWKDELAMEECNDDSLSEEDQFRHYQEIIHQVCQPIILEEMASLRID